MYFSVNSMQQYPVLIAKKHFTRSTFMLKINIQLTFCKFIEMSESNEKTALKAMFWETMLVLYTAFASEMQKHDGKKTITNYTIVSPFNAMV